MVGDKGNVFDKNWNDSLNLFLSLFEVNFLSHDNVVNFSDAQRGYIPLMVVYFDRFAAANSHEWNKLFGVFVLTKNTRYIGQYEIYPRF